MAATAKQVELNEIYWAQNQNFPATAKAAGVTLNAAVKHLAYGAKNGLLLAKNDAPVDPTSGDVRLEDTESGPDRSIVSTSSKIRTLEQLLKYCKIDLKRWEVAKHVVNSWGSAENKNFQVKAWLRLRGDELSVEELKSEFADAARTHSPVYPKSIPKIAKSGNAAEIDIHDLHFGSLCWAPETGENYDINIAQKIYLDAVESLLAYVLPHNPDEIMFPVGSDFFNVNSKLNTTAAGTPQDEDCRWQKTYVYGRRMVVQAVDRLREFAPVKIFVIPGNHDDERAFYLGDSLEAWYRKCDNVTVDNSPTLRKYWQWGKCLIGLTHGKEEVKGTLPLIMASEVPNLWADTRYREWHIGHLHHRATKSYDYATENNGVRERLLSSLAATDSWHKKKGYSGIREAEAFIWNKEQGRVANFSWHPY